MINKRGQGMSINTVIILILAIVVLVVLILGFTMGWGKLTPFLSKSNVQDIAGICQTACATQGTYDFCHVNRELRDKEKNEFTTTCAVFSTVDKFDKYGVESCGMECSSLCLDISINGTSGDSTLIQGTYDVSSLAKEKDCFIN